MTLTRALRLAEEAGLAHAFHNLVGYSAVTLQQSGKTQASQECMTALTQQKAEAAAEAQAVINPDSTPEQRLEQWFQLRGFDQEVGNQKLVSRLEELVRQDYPEQFSASLAWLRRGLSPQAAFVRAAGQRRSGEDAEAFDAGQGDELAEWVWAEREVIAGLNAEITGADERTAAEALYEKRARRDFHLRVLMGLTRPEQVAELEAVDAALALAISAVWVGDMSDAHPAEAEIDLRLMQFATHMYERTAVSLQLHQRLRAALDAVPDTERCEGD